MNLPVELMRARTKEHRDMIADYVGQDPKRFEAILDIMLNSTEPKLREYAAWPVSHIGYNHPEIAFEHCATLIEVLHKKDHPAIHRCALRVLQKIDIPEDLQGKAFDICFELLCDMKRPIALRVFSMTVLDNIAKGTPELLEELKTVIRDLYEHGSKGFKSRARKILK